jgi:NADPH-dependent curcumin reductase CurA
MENGFAEDKIKWKETVVTGIENAPKAFIGLFKGENFVRFCCASANYGRELYG